MRGRTWQFNVNQIAGQLLAKSPNSNVAEVAVKAANMVDAVYAEQRKRNAADFAAAAAADSDIGPLHSAADIFGEDTEN